VGIGTRAAPGAAASPARPRRALIPHLRQGSLPPRLLAVVQPLPEGKSIFIQSSEEPFGSQLALFQQHRPKPAPCLPSSAPEHPLHPGMPSHGRSALTAPPVPWHPAGRQKGRHPKSDFRGKWGPARQAATLQSPSGSPGCLSCRVRRSGSSPRDARPPLGSGHCCSPWKGPSQKNK